MRPNVLSGLLMALAFGALPPVSAQTLQLPGATRAPSPSAPTVSGTETRAADFILAVVNSEPITNNEVQTRMARIEQQLSRQGTVPPRNQLARDVLERLISERAQLQLARELDLRPDEAAVDQAATTVARQNQLSLDELKSSLATDGVDYTKFRADLRDELTLVRLREREVAAGLARAAGHNDLDPSGQHCRGCTARQHPKHVRREAPGRRIPLPVPLGSHGAEVICAPGPHIRLPKEVGTGENDGIEAHTCLDLILYHYLPAIVHRRPPHARLR